MKSNRVDPFKIPPFWITRPYEWQKLLAAKVLFAVAWIGVPFLLAQSLILAEAGYSPLTYPPGLLLNLLGVGTVFLLPLFSLATVTANFARLTFTLLACLAIFVGCTFLTDGILRGSYTSANPYTNWLLYPLLFCGCTLAIVLQYATRRVWVSRALLIVLPFLLALTVAANRRQSLVDRAYPQPGAASSALLRCRRRLCRGYCRLQVHAHCGRRLPVDLSLAADAELQIGRASCRERV